MIEIVEPAVRPALTHHGGEVIPLVQFLTGGGFSLALLVGFVVRLLSGLNAHARPSDRTGDKTADR